MALLEDEFIEEKNIKAENSPSNKDKNLNTSISRRFLGMLLLMSPIILISNLLPSDELYTPKNTLKSELTIMINNEADLDSIKHYYNSIDFENWGLVYGWSNNKNEHYKSDVSLLAVLKDIKNDSFLNKTEDGVKLEKITTLISEYQQKNPFDGLETLQKDQFHNIRLKLGSEYELVSIELNKLSDELILKNKLVSQYLTDSKNSYYLSIISLGLAIFSMAILPLLRSKFFPKKTVNEASSSS